MDVVDLREFYQSPLGRSARGLIGRALQSRLSPRPGQTLLGLGFAHPFFEEGLPPDVVALSFMLARHAPLRPILVSPGQVGDPDHRGGVTATRRVRTSAHPRGQRRQAP